MGLARFRAELATVAAVAVSRHDYTKYQCRCLSARSASALALSAVSA